MPEQISKNFRADFLLALTKEIIENTEVYNRLRIKKEVKDIVTKEREKQQPKLTITQGIKKERIKEFVREKIKEESEKISEMEKVGLLPELRMISRPIEKPIKIPPLLRIPEPELPETVSYLKPHPTEQEIELGKLNVLVKDPLVKIIECNGPDENILVMGMMGRKPTAIKLSNEEIDEILESFSQASRIPVHEGLFKAAVGNLVISAVISEIAGIKFVIRKISREL